jgi:uncharacterized protein
MELEGSQTLAATSDQVWSALFNGEVLAQAIPGCESLVQNSETSFSAVVKLKIGPVSARFKGDVEISDIVSHTSCTLSGKGSGGIAGFAKGAARVVLVPENGVTVLNYTADVSVGGKLAALGNRLIRSTAQKLTSEFFTNFNSALAVRDEVTAE